MLTHLRPLLVSSLLLLLAACAGERRPGPAAEAPPGNGQGIYKIGNPYQIGGTWYYPAEDWSYDETGIASWYGEDFKGKYTANGEIFDLNALTAAHRTLPMPSVVQVTNLENGRSIKLRVNDRGPFARGRIIDVSRRAAQLLGFESPGTARVRVRILVPESIQVASIARHNGAAAETQAAAMPAAPLAPVAAEALPPPPGNRPAANVPEPPPPAPSAPPPMLAQPVPQPPLPEKVVSVPVHATHIYVQAGAFARADNAMRLQAKLARVGTVEVKGARVNGIDLYRVRLGPVASVDEADKLLARVVDAGISEARIVVD